MNNESFSLSDRLLLGASLLMAIAIAFLLMNSNRMIHFVLRRQMGDHELGKILDFRHDVRHRMNQSLTWYPANSDEKVFDRDSLFTGENSELDIELNQGQRIHLNPNSLLLMQTDRNELILNLQLGSFRIVRAPQTRSATPSLSEPKSVSGSKTDPPVLLKVLSSNPSETITIEPTANPVLVRVQESGAIVTKQLPPIQTTPKNTSIAASEPETAAETEPEERPPEPPAVPIEKPVVKLPVVKKLPPPMPVVPKSVDAPRLRSPADDTKLVLFAEAEFSPLVFAWRPVAAAEKYEIQFAEDASFHIIYLSSTGTQTVYLMTTPPTANTLYWRVRASTPQNVSAWSETRRIELENSH